MDNLRQRGLLKDNLRDNIESLIELRDNSIHFINPDSISKQVQELGFACIKNYMSIIKEWTIKIDLSGYNFYLMPLAYVDEKKIVTGTLTNETMNYINLVKEKVNHMDNSDFEYAVAISIDVEFKKGNTFASSGVNYAPDGIKVSLSEEDIRSRFPWTRKDVIDRCCDRYTNFKQNADMNSVFSKIKENPKLSHARKLYPNKERPVTFFYSANILKEFDKHYTKNELIAPTSKNRTRFFALSEFVNIRKHARFLPRKLLIINAGFESPTVRKRCMQRKWPDGMHTICIGMFTICIENLAGKWLRKVVGR